jgi:hypothetical protein
VQTKPMTPAQFTKFMQDEVTKWAPIARRIAEAK